MKRKIITVCIVGILGILAGALAFVVEVKRVKENQIQYAPPDKCIYPRSPALALGLTAAVALIIAQSIINVATGCLCCKIGTYQINPRQIGAVLCSTISWFTFVMSILLLLISAALNDKRGEESTLYGNYSCSAVKDGIFVGAAILSLATVALGILSYMMSESAENRGDPRARSVAPEQLGIAMGQPQLSQQRSPDSMFVDEDSYTSQQTA